MLSFKILKKLKAAQFPKKEFRRCKEHGFDFEPTLSELIKGCGPHFKGLMASPDCPDTWLCVKKTGTIQKSPYAKNKFVYKNWSFISASSPEEAAALLYLSFY